MANIQTNYASHPFYIIIWGGGGLVANGWAYQLRVPVSADHFSLVILPSGLRSPTCCHNTILDETAELYA